jgi:putative ABC transport system permease protein
MVADFEASRGEAVRDFLAGQSGVRSVELIRRARLYLMHEHDAATDDPLVVAQCASGPGDAAGNSVVIADDLARRWSVRPGSLLEFETQTGVFHAIVSATYRPGPEEKFWYEMSVDCSRLSESDLFQAAMVQIQRDRSGEDRVGEIRRSLSAKFPTLATVTSQEIEETIGGALGDAVTLVRIITWSAGAGGLIILMVIVASSRLERSREIGILAALGATRWSIVQIYSLEFVLIGLLSGVIGSLLALGLDGAILFLLLQGAAVSWRDFAAVPVLCALFTACAGWLPTHRLLGRKPMEVLHSE